MNDLLTDLVQLNRVAPELARDMVTSTLSLALALHSFCRNSAAKLKELPPDVQQQAEAWQQLLVRAKQAVHNGFNQLPHSPYQAVVKVAEVLALRGNKL